MTKPHVLAILVTSTLAFSQLASAAPPAKNLLALDSMAGAVCANICTTPTMPFHAVIVMKACESALQSAGGLDQLEKLAAKSKDVSRDIDESLEGFGLKGGLKALRGLEAETDKAAKERACGTATLFSVFSGAREALGAPSSADVRCLKGGLTQGGCEFTNEQIEAENDAHVLFQSGLDRAVASFFDRVDSLKLAGKLAASIKDSGAAYDYLVEVQGGTIPKKLKALSLWGREHSKEVLSATK